MSLAIGNFTSGDRNRGMKRIAEDSLQVLATPKKRRLKGGDHVQGDTALGCCLINCKIVLMLLKVKVYFILHLPTSHLRFSTRRYTSRLI